MCIRDSKNSIEETYRSRIDALLSSVVGEENVRSEVDVTMDFTETEATYEEFDNNRNGPKARSEILTQENNSTMAALGIPGSMNNTNPGLATGVVDGQLRDDPVGTDGSSSTRQTRNYELDRAVRHVKMRGGMIKRISVAVIINEREVEAPPPPAPVVAEGEEAPAGQETCLLYTSDAADE